MSSSLRGVSWGGVPGGIDHRKLSTLYRKRAMKVMHDYTLRYVSCFDDPKERRGSYHSFPGLMTNYLLDRVEDCMISGATEKQIEEVIREWSELFDRRPQAGPHSDFLRLHFLACRNDKAAFLALLTRMQQKHPDPRAEYWKRFEISVDIYRLFGITTEHSTFHLWFDGKRGIGDLPYKGYSAQKDTHKPVKQRWEEDP
jgi:hypothetical protein